MFRRRVPYHSPFHTLIAMRCDRPKGPVFSVKPRKFCAGSVNIDGAENLNRAPGPGRPAGRQIHQLASVAGTVRNTLVGAPDWEVSP